MKLCSLTFLILNLKNRLFPLFGGPRRDDKRWFDMMGEGVRLHNIQKVIRDMERWNGRRTEVKSDVLGEC